MKPRRPGIPGPPAYRADHRGKMGPIGPTNERRFACFKQLNPVLVGMIVPTLAGRNLLRFCAAMFRRPTRPITAHEASRKLLRAPRDSRRDAAFRKAIRQIPRGKVATYAKSPPPPATRSITARWLNCCAHPPWVRSPGNACWDPAAPSSSTAKPPWNSACASKWKACGSAANESIWKLTSTGSVHGNSRSCEPVRQRKVQ